MEIGGLSLRAKQRQVLTTQSIDSHTILAVGRSLPIRIWHFKSIIPNYPTIVPDTSSSSRRWSNQSPSSARLLKLGVGNGRSRSGFGHGEIMRQSKKIALH